MKQRFVLRIIVIGLLVALNHPVLSAQTRERADIDNRYKWKLEDVYPSDQAWEQAKTELSAKFEQVGKYKGTLSKSASQLLACLELDSRISKELGRVCCYATFKSDQDTRDSKSLAVEQQAQQLAADYHTAASFIVPEISSMTAQQIDQFISTETGLKVYRMMLHDILRRKAHTLSDKEKKLLAQASLMASAPSSIFNIFSDADLPYPEITLSDGTVVQLDKTGYMLHRASASRADREAGRNGGAWGGF